MEVTHYTYDGKRYREIVSHEYAPLQLFQKDYEKAGHRTNLNPCDAERWMLTVELGPEKTATKIQKIQIEIGRKTYAIDLETGDVSTYEFSRGCDESGDSEGFEVVGKIVKVQEAL